MAYTGKYPYDIKVVSSVAGSRGIMRVTTNNGQKFDITAKSTNGAMPQLGKHVFTYDAELVDG